MPLDLSLGNIISLVLILTAVIGTWANLRAGQAALTARVTALENQVSTSVSRPEFELLKDWIRALINPNKEQ